MYLDTATIIGITIALGASLFMMFILAFANTPGDNRVSAILLSYFIFVLL